MQFEKLQKDMIAAMKARDKVRKDTIAALVSGAKKIAIDEGSRDNITEDITDRAIMKELRAAKEQYESCPDSRADLKAEYKTRFDIISEYAPKMMSEDQIREVLQTKFADVLATKNKGQIMKNVMPALKGKADGKTISKIVAELCS
ncbi:MAG: GatB/YqeY domain-containing protein [Eubacterium sp.]|nr:GatB/YqeY domain-containing protein [Eubacterium sp.]